VLNALVEDLEGERHTPRVVILHPSQIWRIELLARAPGEGEAPIGFAIPGNDQFATGFEDQSGDSLKSDASMLSRECRYLAQALVEVAGERALDAAACLPGGLAGGE